MLVLFAEAQAQDRIKEKDNNEQEKRADNRGDFWPDYKINPTKARALSLSFRQAQK